MTSSTTTPLPGPTTAGARARRPFRFPRIGRGLLERPGHPDAGLR